MLESYSSTLDDYDVINYSEKMAISILKTATISKLKREETKAYTDTIKRINYYRLSQHNMLIPDGLLYTEIKGVLKPVYQVSFPTQNLMNEYAAKIKRYTEGI